MKRIKYISHYGCKDQWRKRDNSPASDTKKEYIFNVLNRCGYAVDHISRASGAIPGQYIPSYVEKQGINTFRYFATFGRQENRILRALNTRFVHLQFFLWLFFNLKRGEQVIVTHSLGYDSTFIWLKRLKGIKILGDIEDIYQDVHQYNNRVRRNEYKFIEICDKYFFVNSMLDERINPNNKPHLTINGIYKVNDFVKESYNDGKIHIMYGGTFDPVKGGASAAIKAAEYLPENYHLHITGFGSNEQALNLSREAEIINVKSKATISFHGFLEDSEFLKLMHHCTIGLCTQDPSKKLNDTSFPSKILNYLSNGLVVLTGDNNAIRNSEVGDVVYYYTEQTPHSIANAILSIKKIDYTIGINRLRQLDIKFEQDLKGLLE